MSGPGYVFEVDGEHAVPTDLARGPWSADAQHGGAPAALLAGQLERFDLEAATFPARFTVELMRPVPLAPLRIVRRTIRPGGKVQLVEGSLYAGDVEVVRATLLRLRQEPLALDEQLSPGLVNAMPPLRPSEPPLTRFARGTGFWSALEMIPVGGDWPRPGPKQFWFRLVVPIVAGEEPSPFQRVAAVADFGNGVAPAFDLRLHSAINPDLTLALHRLPVREWVGLDAATYGGEGGHATAESVLHDENGRLGRAVQTVLVGNVTG